MKKRKQQAKKQSPKQSLEPSPIALTEDEEAAHVAEDWDRELYGDDYEHLKDSGWIDR